jgi:hypothetical protein
MRFKLTEASAVVIALGIGLSGCVQMPTESHSVVDQRPQIAFRFDVGNDELSQARVLVDDVEVGRAGDFIDGKASLRILPGTHTFKVVLGQRIVLSERAYLADGVVRPFIIN